MDDKNEIILKLVKSHGLSDWNTCDRSIKHIVLLSYSYLEICERFIGKQCISTSDAT